MDNQDSYIRCGECNQLIQKDGYNQHLDIHRNSTEGTTEEKQHPLTGNNYAMKFKTSEERRKLCENYIKHLREGKPKEYFPLADPQTIRRYIKDFPEDFDTEAIEQAEREGKNNLLTIGYAGMTGKIPGFNTKTWQFIIQNMTHWKLRTDVTSDDEKIEPIQIYKPEKLPEGS